MATRQPGNSPVSDEASEPWRVALQAGPEGISLAVRTKRNAGKRGAPKPCSRPLSHDDHAAAAALDGKRKGVKGTLAALLRLRPSRVARRRIAHYHLATPPPRGRVMQPRGAVDCFGVGSKRHFARARLRDSSEDRRRFLSFPETCGPWRRRAA